MLKIGSSGKKGAVEFDLLTLIALWVIELIELGTTLLPELGT